MRHELLIHLSSSMISWYMVQWLMWSYMVWLMYHVCFVTQYACLYPMVQATFASPVSWTSRTGENWPYIVATAVAVPAAQTWLRLSGEWCDERQKFLGLRPEVIKLLASLLQRSRIGSPVPEDCRVIDLSCRSCACAFRAFHRNLQAFTTRTHGTDSMWLVMYISLHTLRGRLSKVPRVVLSFCCQEENETSLSCWAAKWRYLKGLMIHHH